MTALLQKNKNLIIAIVVILLAFWAYNTFFKSEGLVTSDNIAADEVGSDVLDLSASLQSVTLDQSLFASPLYKHLIDFSLPIPSQPSGRVNPFDIIGRD